MATVPERLATLEAKVDTMALALGVVQTDVRTLLVRDIERAILNKYVSRVTRLIPWAAVATAIAALLK